MFFRLQPKQLRLAGIAILIFFASPNNTALAVTQLHPNLPFPQATNNTIQELLNLGCVRPTVVERNFEEGVFKEVKYPDTHPFRVLPKNVTTDRLVEDSLFCTAEVRFHQINLDLDDAKKRENIAKEIESSQPAVPLWQRNIIWIVNAIIILFAQIGMFIVTIASEAIAPLLSLTQFITHPYVEKGWPFVQGIVNLGFILVMLFIAAATALRLEVGGGVRKLLPRLLIAALLVNFSLVIGAVIIDASRVVMAAIINILGVDKLSQIGLQILEHSQLPEGIVRLGSFEAAGDTIEATSSWSMPLKFLESALLIWIMAIGLGIVAIGLLVRYIALILLLMVSPFPYLAFAMPGAQNLANKWWQEFLKWVVYGPLLVFLLTVISVSGAALSTEKFGGVLGPIINIVLVAVLLIFTALFGLKFGGSGVAFALGAATRTGRGGFWAGTKLASPIIRPLQERWDARKDYKKKQEETRKKYYGRRAGYEDRLRDYKQQWRTPQQIERAEERTAAARALGPVTNMNVDDPAIAAPRLSNNYTIQGLGPDAEQRLVQVRNIVAFGNFSQIRSLLKNKDYLRTLNDEQRVQLQQELENKAVERRRDPATGAMADVAVNVNTHQRTLERLVDVFEQIDNE